MKLTIKGTIQPPRGTPGANGAYTVDLDVEIPERIARLIEVAGVVISDAGEIPESVRQAFALSLERSTGDGHRTREELERRIGR